MCSFLSNHLRSHALPMFTSLKYRWRSVRCFRTLQFKLVVSYSVTIESHFDSTALGMFRWIQSTVLEIHYKLCKVLAIMQNLADGCQSARLQLKNSSEQKKSEIFVRTYALRRSELSSYPMASTSVLPSFSELCFVLCIHKYFMFTYDTFQLRKLNHSHSTE